MAEVRYNVCDRCGRRLNYSKGWTGKLFGAFNEHANVQFELIYHGNQSGYDYLEKYMELCCECTEELRKFLKNTTDK